MAQYRFLLWICLQGLVVAWSHADSSPKATSASPTIITYQTTTPNQMTDSQIQVIPVESRHVETTVSKQEQHEANNKSEPIMSASSLEDKTPSASEATPTASSILGSSSSSSGKGEGGQQSNQQQQHQQSGFLRPGFTMLTNKEVAPGHVTMIGYTTPIVKVGEPIPLEQFLKQQQEYQQSQAKYQEQFERLMQSEPLTMPASSFIIRPKPKDTAPSAAMEAPVKMYAPVKKSKQLIAASEPEETPMYHDQPSQQPYSYSYHVTEQNNQPLIPPIPSQYQPQPQAQPQQQYAAPLEKPRPFLVYKPKYQKLQQALKHQPLALSGQVPLQMVTPSKSLNILPISELSNNELEAPQLSSPFAQQVSPQQTSAPVSPFVQSKAIEFGWAKPQSALPQASIAAQFQPRPQPTPSYLKSQPQAQMPQLFGQPFEFPGKSVTSYVDSSSTSGGKIDPKTELQNQIHFLLSNSPNLSDDTKVRHREQIIKAVAESLGSSEETSSLTNPSSQGYSPYSNIPESNKLMLMSKQPISHSHYPKMVAEKQSSYTVPKLPESINDQLIKSNPNEPSSYLAAPPPLSYKHKMQQQIQQYLQEQIDKEAQGPSYLPSLLAQQQAQQLQHQPSPVAMSKYTRKYLPGSEAYIQQQQHHHPHQHNHYSPVQQQHLQQNPINLMAHMLLNSQEDTQPTTKQQQNPNKVKPELPTPRYTLSRQTLYQAQQQQQQQQKQQQPTSGKSQVYHHRLSMSPSTVKRQPQTTQQVANTYQHLYSNYPQPGGQIVQPEATSRNTREFSEWWKESAAASALPPPAQPMALFYNLAQ